MIDFKPIATTDKELLTSFILPSDEQDCDFSFANLCSWHFMTGIQLCPYRGSFSDSFRHF